jgi:hypothetical protein
MYNAGSPSSKSTSEPNCNIWCEYKLYPMYKMWSGALDWLHEYIRKVPLWSSLSCHVVKSVWGDPTACRFCKGVRGSYTMHKAYKGSRCDRPAYFDPVKALTEHCYSTIWVNPSAALCQYALRSKAGIMLIMEWRLQSMGNAFWRDVDKPGLTRFSDN